MSQATYRGYPRCLAHYTETAQLSTRFLEVTFEPADHLYFSHQDMFTPDFSGRAVSALVFPLVRL